MMSETQTGCREPDPIVSSEMCVGIMTLFEIWMELAGFQLRQASQELTRLQSMPDLMFHNWQRDKAWQVAGHHYRTTDSYKRKVGSRLPEIWQELPIMHKSDFQKARNALISADFRNVAVYSASTSGSSGVPFQYCKDKSSHGFAWALIGERYGWHGINFGHKQARFYGIPLERWSHIAETAKDMLMHRARFPVFDLTDQRLGQYLSRLRKGNFTYLYGYASALRAFAKFLSGTGLVLREEAPSIKLCITTSEVCSDEDRRIMEHGFGVSVVDEYGSSEVGIIAFQDLHGRSLVSEETVLLEVVDDHGSPLPDGNEGDILVTDLRNRAMPFIRYNLGDRGVVAPERVGKYRVLQTLKGRTSDLIYLPSGRRCAGLTLYYVIRGLLEETGVVKECVIHQMSLDTFVFDLVAVRQLNDSEMKMLMESMDTYLEPGLHVSVNYVQHIFRAPNGKRKQFFSELSRSSEVVTGDCPTE